MWYIHVAASDGLLSYICLFFYDFYVVYLKYYVLYMFDK